MSNLKLSFRNVDLDIYIHGNKLIYNINKDIDINILRKNFNNLIASLSAQNNSLEYWLMKISERNTLIHDLFLDYCKVVYIDKLNENNNVHIYTDNIALYEHYKQFSKIKFIDKIKFDYKKFLKMGRPYLQLALFFIKNLALYFVLYRKKTVKDISSHTVIQTWINSNNFDKSFFSNHYYKDLQRYLMENGRKVVVWASLIDVKINKKFASAIIKNENILIMESYLSLHDYIDAGKIFFKKRHVNFNNIQMAEMDLTKIFNYYKKLETINNTTLFYFFAKRLSLMKCNNITFIQNFENMSHEKSLILGVNKYLKDCFVVGYFHTSKPDNLLCLEFSTIAECKISPKPDVIIFNSPAYKKIFNDKFPSLKTRNGYAFKQAYMENFNLHSSRSKSEDILVLFSGVDSDVRLMFDFLNKVSLKNNFIFKMHPLNVFDIKKYYLYDNYEVCDSKSIGSALNKVNKVISTYSASILECAIQGVHVGLVYNPERLLLNPFDGTIFKNYDLISSADEVMQFIESDAKITSKEPFFNLAKKTYSSCQL